MSHDGTEKILLLHCPNSVSSWTLGCGYWYIFTIILQLHYEYLLMIKNTLAKCFETHSYHPAVSGILSVWAVAFIPGRVVSLQQWLSPACALLPLLTAKAEEFHSGSKLHGQQLWLFPLCTSSSFVSAFLVINTFCPSCLLHYGGCASLFLLFLHTHYILLLYRGTMIGMMDTFPMSFFCTVFLLYQKNFSIKKRLQKKCWQGNKNGYTSEIQY